MFITTRLLAICITAKKIEYDTFTASNYASSVCEEHAIKILLTFSALLIYSLTIAFNHCQNTEEKIKKRIIIIFKIFSNLISLD